MMTNDAGDYYRSITYEVKEELPEKNILSEERSVDMYMRLKKFATLSDGVTVENPRFIWRVENRIKKLQKQL